MSPARPRGAPAPPPSLATTLDKNRFLIMALVGLLLTGFMLHQRHASAAGVATPRQSRAERAGGETTAVAVAAAKPKGVHDPRTSKIHARNEPREDDKWIGVHNKYTYEVETKAKAGNVKTVFYGDATFEAFRGSKIGIHQPSLDAAAARWAKHFKANSLALAVSGDTASNVLWRIRNGEWPSPLNPKVLVVAVGTNDIKRAAVEGEPADLEEGSVPGKALADAIGAIVGTLLEDVPTAHVIVVAVPPRGDEAATDRHAQPSKYSASINAANKALAAYAAAHASSVTFVDCNAALMEGGRIKADAMPDGVHIGPSAYEAFAGGCLAPAVTKAMAA